MYSNAKYENIYNYLNNFQNNAAAYCHLLNKNKILIFYNLYQQSCFWDKKPKKVFVVQ